MSNGFENKTDFVISHNVSLDSEYVQWVHEIKERYRNAQIKTAIKVNSEKLLFNWQLGRDLVRRKAEERWGSGIVEQLSLDLQNEFPDAKGFSTTNLWYMKKWYSFYQSSDHIEKLQQVVGALENKLKLKNLILNKTLDNSYEAILQQAVGELDFPFVFSFVPWGHHIEIITKCKSIEEALFYIQKIVEESWSRRTLQNCLDADMFHHTGNAATNFDQILPESQSKLSQEITKDNYDLSFFTLPKNYDEMMLEEALEQNITRFLLELGTGFAFVGRQKEIIIAWHTTPLGVSSYHNIQIDEIVNHLPTPEQIQKQINLAEEEFILRV